MTIFILYYHRIVNEYLTVPVFKANILSIISDLLSNSLRIFPFSPFLKPCITKKVLAATQYSIMDQHFKSS